MLSLRSLLRLLPLAGLVASLGALAVTVSGQAPDPPPIWPAQFTARFGLYMFDVPSESPIFNATSQFLYHVDTDFSGQMIQYPDRCVPVLPGGEKSPCNILFLEQGIYWNQPDLGIECCQFIAGVGPTPRNFTRGFAWNGTAVAPDYYGNFHDTDFYVSPDGTFKYWTEVAVPPVTAHHDIFFRDGSGAFWAWDHLDVTPVDPSKFALFSDPTTCATSCGVMLGLPEEEQTAMHARAAKSGMVGLAMHHAKMANQHQHHHHHHAHGKPSTTVPKSIADRQQKQHGKRKQH